MLKQKGQQEIDFYPFRTLSVDVIIRISFLVIQLVANTLPLHLISFALVFRVALLLTTAEPLGGELIEQPLVCIPPVQGVNESGANLV